jgi:hypothetical protein
MTLADMIDTLGLELLTEARDFSDAPVRAGYASDLLSRVLAEAPHYGVWVTLQAHNNVVAVAAVLELAAVIISSGSRPDADTIAKANEEGVPLLATAASTFTLVGRMWELGVR